MREDKRFAVYRLMEGATIRSSFDPLTNDGYGRRSSGSGSTSRAGCPRAGQCKRILRAHYVMNRQTNRLLFAVACIASSAAAQPPVRFDLAAVGKDPRWKSTGRTTSIVDIMEKPALKISEGPGMGLVRFDGYHFGEAPGAVT